MTVKITLKCAAVFLGVWSLAAQASAQEAGAPKTSRDKVSYGVGVDMARNLKSQGVEVDLDLVIQGLRDEFSGKKLLIPDRELRRLMTMFQVEQKKGQGQARVMSAAENKKAGEAFLAENDTKEGVVTLLSGLQYKILKAGNGKKPTDTDTVECSYRGTLINGTEFDASAPGKSATLRVSALIPGWSEALKLMPVGSRWQIFIPSQLAYGEKGSGRNIGPNETLVFELELLAIK
jgi:FKBP-type peptidyl-prolyl cis-trans isomerase